MKRIAVALALITWAPAQTAPDLRGVWELNLAKSKFVGTPPSNRRLRIEQEPSAVTVTTRQVAANAEVLQETNRYPIGQDAKTTFQMVSMSSHIEWDGAALVVRSAGSAVGRELHLVQRWSLSADGNTLTHDFRFHIDSNPEQNEVQTFDRRPAGTWEPDAPSKMAEEVYKNIQIMKGVPAPRLRETMLNFTQWLGVNCVYCHATPPAFDKDEKPAKQTARKMLQMVRAMGHDYFGDANPVTCWTCHRGKPKPPSLPE